MTQSSNFFVKIKILGRLS